MFDVFDQISPEGISPEELEKLQERIAIIQDKGLWVAEHSLVGWTSSGGRSYETALDDTEQPLGYDLIAIDEADNRYVCVKSTEGGFNNPLHISYNELRQMRDTESYDLYRIYDVIEMRAKLRIARDMKSFAQTVLAVLEQLPDGIRSDSISIEPDVLNFEGPIDVEIPNDEE